MIYGENIVRSIALPVVFIISSSVALIACLFFNHQNRRKHELEEQMKDHYRNGSIEVNIPEEGRQSVDNQSSTGNSTTQSKAVISYQTNITTSSHEKSRNSLNIMAAENGLTELQRRQDQNYETIPYSKGIDEPVTPNNCPRQSLNDGTSLRRSRISDDDPYSVISDDSEPPRVRNQVVNTSPNVIPPARNIQIETTSDSHIYAVVNKKKGNSSMANEASNRVSTGEQATTGTEPNFVTTAALITDTSAIAPVDEAVLGTSSGIHRAAIGDSQHLNDVNLTVNHHRNSQKYQENHHLYSLADDDTSNYKQNSSATVMTSTYNVTDKNDALPASLPFNCKPEPANNKPIKNNLDEGGYEKLPDFMDDLEEITVIGESESRSRESMNQHRNSGRKKALSRLQSGAKSVLPSHKSLAGFFSTSRLSGRKSKRSNEES